MTFKSLKANNIRNIRTVIREIQMLKYYVLIALLVGLFGASASCILKRKHQNEVTSLADYQKIGKSFNNELSPPVFETSPTEIELHVSELFKNVNADLDKIAKLKKESITFENSLLELEAAYDKMHDLKNRISFLMNVSPQKSVREMAKKMVDKMEEWFVKVHYREDLYRVINNLADKSDSLSGDDKNLLDRYMLVYKRAGLQLSEQKRKKVEKLRRELTEITNKFKTNIRECDKLVYLSPSNVEGVPPDQLEELERTKDGKKFIIKPNIDHEVKIIIKNAKKESVRKLVAKARRNVAKKPNAKLLVRIVKIRSELSSLLRYETWGDYQAERKMAQNAQASLNFLKELSQDLEPKFRRELEELRELKVRETGDTDAQICSWDVSYFKKILNREKYDLHLEEMRVFFPYENVLIKMFDIFEHLFSIRISKVEAPYTWVPDVELYAINDKTTSEPLGLFYLDMFPRKGKYEHFATFTLIEGRRGKNNHYRRPISALVGNFPKPLKDRPSLLTYSHVETLFHEFGHILHVLLSQAKYSTFSGTNVPRDFVEVPSQMLEYWLEDEKVLGLLASHYKDPTEKIPEDFLKKLKMVRKEHTGTFYRGQIAFAMLDLKLHTEIDKKSTANLIEYTNNILETYYLPNPEDSAFATSFGHLIGYDAGYYSYTWAKAISADMVSLFENSAQGFLDQEIGMRLRKTVFEVGESRDVNYSIMAFLGREFSLKPFLRRLGIRQEYTVTTSP